MNSGTYLKFNSELSEKGREEYFISIKSYNRIKKYLSMLNQLEAARSKGNENIKPSFAIGYSAFVNGLSIDSKKDHQFAWVDEIRQISYFSFYDLLTYLVNADRDSQMLRRGVLLGYSYTHELLHSNFVLIKTINELNLAPKSIMPLIERSLKSGNKEFCQTIRNPEKPIVVERLNRRQRNMLSVLVKYCPENFVAQNHFSNKIQSVESCSEYNTFTGIGSNTLGLRGGGSRYRYLEDEHQKIINQINT